MITIQNMKTPGKIFAILFYTLIAAPVYSAPISDTYTAGDTLTATTMNNIKSAVNDNDTRTTTNTGNITTNTGNITTNAGGIVTNAGDITANTAAIALKGDATAVSANTAAIVLKGDATDVSANTAAIALKGDATDVSANTAAIALKGDATDVTANTNAIALKGDATDVSANTAAIAAINGCPSDMTAVGSLCVDIYEASVWDGPTTSDTIIIGTDINTACAQDGSTCGLTGGSPIYALSESGQTPSTHITYYQASVACANVGKRLPTVNEWLMAAAGTTGGNGDGAADNCYNVAGGGSTAPRNTGSPSNCVSTAGAYDMVGNVFELTANVVFPAATTPTIDVGDTLTTLDTARVLAMGSDYKAFGTNEDIKDVLATGTSDSNFTTGFRCVK